MDTQYRKNLKAVLTASKDYTDNSIEKLKWELGTYDLSVTTDSTVAYTKTIPTNAIKGRLNYIGGASKVSENLIVLQDVAETTENGITYKIENGIIYLISGTATINKNIRETTFTLPAGTYYFKSFGTTGSNSTYFSYLQAPIEGVTLIRYSYDNKSFTLSEETEVQYIWAVRGGVSVSNLQFKDMVVRGTTAPTEFSEGFENIRSAKTTSVVVSGTDVAPITKAIPQEVLNDVRYGLGFSDTQFNKLDLITKHLTGEWNIVDLGSLNWTAQYGVFYNSTFNYAFVQGQVKFLCAKYKSFNYQGSLINFVNGEDKSITFTSSSNFFLKDNQYGTDTQALKTALSGVYLLYQTATQFDMDFSQYIDDDFKNIDTTYMTTATFENEFGYDVPSEIDYLIEEVKA